MQLMEMAPLVFRAKDQDLEWEIMDLRKTYHLLIKKDKTHKMMTIATKITTKASTIKSKTMVLTKWRKSDKPCKRRSWKHKILKQNSWNPKLRKLRIILWKEQVDKAIRVIILCHWIKIWEDLLNKKGLWWVRELIIELLIDRRWGLRNWVLWFNSARRSTLISLN